MNPNSTYLNSVTFPGFSDNLNKYYLDFFTTWKAESSMLFIQQSVGENAETVKLIREIDMDQYAHDKPEGVDAQRLNFGEGYEKEIKAYRTGAQLNISYELRVAPRFELGNAITRFVESIPSRMELDRQHRLSFINATSYVNMDGRTVDVSGGDGLAGISAVHPLAFSTTTWSNLVPTSPQLSVTSLEAAEKLAITDILDNYGLPVMMSFTHLIVNKQDPNTERVAREILRSTSLVTQANPGVINTFNTKYELVVLSRVATDAMGRIDSTKSKWWFLAALGNRSNRLQSYELVWEAPHMNPAPAGSNNGVDVYNDDITYGARARYGHGVVSFRGIIGSLAS
jgi:hypothetical protein